VGICDGGIVSIDASVFGTNGEALVKLIERVSRMTAGEARQLHLARKSAWESAWESARAADRVSDWNTATVAVVGAAWTAAQNAAWDDTWDDIWEAAESMAKDAIAALIVQDLISEEHFNTLYGPWASVTEDQN
jgi:hypothetical protein